MGHFVFFITTSIHYSSFSFLYQAFYSQASWGRLEMKSHQPKNRDKTRAKKRKGMKTKDYKKPN
jgi:hypothetical protein